jgi:dTDP-glucose 4,6-dehydratase
MADLESLFAAYPLPELAGQRLFITGATGFIGYWLQLAIHSLNRRGAGIQVVALSRNPESFLVAHPECQAMNWLSWTQGDVRHYDFPEGHFDAFIHGAADTSPAAAANPIELFDTIVSGARHVLDHALAAKTRRILLLSSGAIYGEQPHQVERLCETDAFACAPFQADNAYGEGKRAMEMLGASYAHTHGIEPVVARCFAFIGHGLPEHLAISQFIRDAQENEFIAVNGDGRQLRSFLYAADLAVWLLALLCRGKAGVAYNVGASHAITLAEAAESVRSVLAPAKRVEVLGNASASARQRYVPDTRRITGELKVDIWTDMETAILKTNSARQALYVD